MKTLRSLSVCAGVLALAQVATAASRRADEFDRRVLAELEAIQPEAVPVFVAANEARERDDHWTAASLYLQVRRMAPGFPHALRRQAGAELALGDRQKALALGREAVAAAATPENLAALALSLSRETPAAKPTKAELSEAVRLAERAAAEAPGEFHVLATLAQVAVVTDDFGRLGKAAERLLDAAPDEEVTHEFEALLELSRGRISEAEASLERARALGMPETRYAAFREAIRGARPLPDRVTGAAARIGTLWAGGILLLFGAGWALSRAALRAATQVPQQRGGGASGLGAWLRRSYAVVLWLCCAYYYASIPLVIATVVLTGGGLIYACFAIGRVPVKLVAIVAILVLTTLWSVLKSLFVRVADEDPGVKLNLGSHPRLRKLLHDVASRVGTAPVRSVYLTPGTDMAVMERGGLLRQLRGTAERCLILGVGVLDGMRVGPFKAVLAHEYGHFSNRDTAGGGFALAVRRSLVNMAAGLAQAGAAGWFNPAWLFVNGFYRVFLRISQGASRLQEVLADRWAAALYGAAAFEQGLRHVIERSVRFDAHAGATLREVVERQQPLLNLYQHRPSAAPDEAAVQKAVADALGATPSPYDSHPTPSLRFRWVRALGGRPPAASPEDEAEVWALLEGRDRIEQRLTAEVRDSVHRAHGVRIAGRAERPEPVEA